MTYWAKKDQTYEQHVSAAYKAWQATVEQSAAMIDALCVRFAVSKDRLLKGSLLSVVLHDLGKLTREFQDVMESVRQRKHPDYDASYRHELASFPFVLLASVQLNQEEPLCGKVPLEAIAVLGHHKLLNTDLQAFDREKTKERPTYLRDAVVEGLNLAEALYQDHGWSFPAFDFDKAIGCDPYGTAVKLLGDEGSYHNSELYSWDNDARIRALYAVLKGLLHCSDWNGSAGTSVNLHLKTTAAVIEDVTRQRVKGKGNGFIGWTRFQNGSAETRGHLIAVAPTGSGKTEASLLWAERNLRDSFGGKLLYLLPTMVTANSMYDRLCAFFGTPQVALSHSTADLLLESKAEEQDRDIRRDVLFGKTFMFPATVATVDQFLTTGFNAKHWTLKELNAMQSVAVIDEVHAYDPWTTGLIISAIRHYGSAGVKFMVMSATMPRFLREELSKALGIENVLCDESLTQSSRSRYLVKDCRIQDDLEAIRQAIADGRRVLVVVNNVKDCQELARNLADLAPVCFHSKFIMADRAKKEKEVNEARLAVATQVVEVSLDIDYDWMFTECAPPDAIVQRAGRVHRKRERECDSRIFIYRPGDTARKIYERQVSELLDRSFECFRDLPENATESNLQQLVESVYADFKLEDSEDYRQALGAYETAQRKRLAIYDSRVTDEDLQKEITRLTTYQQVDVIPECYAEKALASRPRDRRWFELKMPLWYVKKHSRNCDGIAFCEMEYDSELGARLLTSDERSCLIT